MALLGGGGHRRAGDSAGAVGVDSLLAPLAPQLLLKGGLQAGAAHGVAPLVAGDVILGVVGVAVLHGLLVLCVGDDAGVAHHVGDQRAVLPVGAGDSHPGLDAGPLAGVLADDAHGLGGDVLGDDVGAGAGKAVLGHGVAHGHHVPGVLPGVALAVVPAGQGAHAVLGGGVLGQLQRLLQGGDGAIAVLGVLIGAVLRQDNGQPVPPRLAPLHEQVQYLEDGGVAGTVVHVQRVVYNVIAGAVARQHVAVPVQNLPPGRLYLNGIGAVGKGDLLELVAPKHLPLEQAELIHCKHRQHQQDAGGGTAEFSDFRHFQRGEASFPAGDMSQPAFLLGPQRLGEAAV